MRGKHVIVPQEVAEQRWEICKQCPHLLYDEVNPDTDKKDGRCTECGCFMNVKTHYATAECPIKKWSEYE
jgi:acetyl-CoA carboxylase beta subunit